MIRVRSLDLVVSVLLIGFGLYLILTGRGYGFIEDRAPGAGYFPILIGAGMLLMAVINLINVLRRAEAVEWIASDEIARVMMCSVAISLFAWLSSHIGMLLAGFLLMVLVAVVFGARSGALLGRASVLALGMSGVLYLIFVKLLAVPLP